MRGDFQRGRGDISQEELIRGNCSGWLSSGELFRGNCPGDESQGECNCLGGNY